jgi:putative two-component system response regulator
MRRREEAIRRFREPRPDPPPCGLPGMSSTGLLIQSPESSPRSVPRILVSDDEAFHRELLARRLRRDGYHCDSCAGGDSALHALHSAPYDLLISDVRTPWSSGSSVIEHVRRIRPETGVMFLASAGDLTAAVEAIKHGAFDYITKPFRPEQVSVSVARALQKRRLQIENDRHRHMLEEQVEARKHQLQETLKLLEATYHSTLVALGTALDSRDAHTGAHSLRVTCYADRLAQALDVPLPERKEIAQGALLHDIGKIGLPDVLLRKPSKLDPSEWALMRRHPEIGWRILSGIRFLRGAALIVLQHHERYDGLGYPAGLKGEAISLGARIFAAVDTLDCVTSDRPFQENMGFEAAAEVVRKGSGEAFDPRVVSAFASISTGEWQRIRQAVSDSGGNDCSRASS